LLSEEVKDKIGYNCIVAVVYSAEDRKCSETIAKFRKLIKLENSFVPITIDRIVTEVIEHTGNYPEIKSLYEDIYNRYCNYILCAVWFCA
jgi:hypothetical protein